MIGISFSFNIYTNILRSVKFVILHVPVNRYTMNLSSGLMQPGMTFTIEPVLSHGCELTVLLEDRWTVVTEDNSRAAQAEHTILITENGAEILTK